MTKSLVDKIHQLLPKTQCTQCGFNGCKPYAEAIAAGTPFNQCPPGGQKLINKLADLLDEEPKALNPQHGTEQPTTVAWIDESVCIGCTKCIQACPVDAIIGRSKHMHTIIESECTGCNLCIPQCPVDCIYTKESSLQPNLLSDENQQQITGYYQMRFDSRNNRLETKQQEQKDKYEQAKKDNIAQRQDYIQQALARAKQKKHD